MDEKPSRSQNQNLKIDSEFQAELVQMGQQRCDVRVLVRQNGMVP